MFKDALQANSSTITTNQITPCTFRTNPKIIRDPVVVRTTGSCKVGSRSEGNEVEAPSDKGLGYVAYAKVLATMHVIAWTVTE